MSVELTTKFAPKTDELFKAESKISLLTNTDYEWTGAHSIKLYKIRRPQNPFGTAEPLRRPAEVHRQFGTGRRTADF